MGPVPGRLHKEKLAGYCDICYLLDTIGGGQSSAAGGPDAVRASAFCCFQPGFRADFHFLRPFIFNCIFAGAHSGGDAVGGGRETYIVAQTKGFILY